MLTPEKQTGMAGEDAAADHVRRLGWRILDRNWRKGPLELDLVCRDGDTVVFLEVKTRSSGGLSGPAAAFTPEKQRRVVRAARAWLAAHRAWVSPCRFDLAAVTLENGRYQTELTSHVIELGAGFGKIVGGGHAPWQPW
jgi:putative endonuclease